MVFGPPEWAPKLPFEIPDDVTIPEFMLNEKFGRYAVAKSRNPWTCGVTGQKYSTAEVKDRVDNLAKGLARELGWSPNSGTAWDKCVGVFSANTIDFVPLSWAIHRLGGIASPANAQYSVDEIAYQLKDSGAKCVFTCLPLLKACLEATAKIGIPASRVYLLEMPAALLGGAKAPPNFKTVSQLIEEGKKQPALEPLKWEKGEGKKRCAFLCYSSGTSGLPKGVMISHYNVIANTMQITTFDKPSRDRLGKDLPDGQEYTENCLGLLPFSHIYALVVINHASLYRGDGIIVLPKFEFQMYLKAIQGHKIATLYLVPPIIILMANNKPTLDQFDISSVRGIFTGAAPLGAETATALNKVYPDWRIRQGYGLTESCTVVSSTSDGDIWYGSSGSIISGCKCRIVAVESGKDVTELDTPGELLINAPSIVLGYLNNDKANAETFVTDSNGERWLKTGDEAVIRKSPAGNEHVFITDRIKELIKVKGLQVAPAELEAHLLAHPHVADVCVIPVPDDQAGEVPKAYVVKSNSIGIEENDRMIKREIAKWVESAKSRHKWLKGGVEFIDVIPKSPSGKILRRVLRDMDKEKRRKQGAKL